MCGDFIPIGFQFSSLVFGYIRKKRERLLSEEDYRDEREETILLESYFDPPIHSTYSSNSNLDDQNNNKDAQFPDDTKTPNFVKMSSQA